VAGLTAGATLTLLCFDMHSDFHSAAHSGSGPARRQFVKLPGGGRWLSVCAALLASLLPLVAQDLPAWEDAARLEQQGKFENAATLLKTALAEPNLTVRQRQRTELELDRLDRIRKDYPLTRDALYSALQASVRDLTPAEFAQWLEAGHFDRRSFDGEERFMSASVSNLFFRHPELAPRRLTGGASPAYQIAVWKNCQDILAAVVREKSHYVLPTRFSCTMTAKVKPDVVPVGEPIRCWLPVPRRYPFQRDIIIRFSQPLERQMADEFSPIRSVYLEQPSAGLQPTVFSVDYTYTAEAIRFDLQPKKSQPTPTNNLAVMFFAGEAPHLVFSPEMRALAAQLAGHEPNPILQARSFYDWVSTNIQYSYALEYSTVRDLGGECLARRYGDCGQEAFLFMTLCRLSGIPARWQSGWFTFPGGESIHDWCEIYLAPWGWVPVDPYMGIWAMQKATHLASAQRQQVRDFYFGGLDQYRMIANSDHCQTLWPARKSLRADTVDFQRGELEAAGKHLYFGQFSYDLVVKEVPPGQNE
jgi:transglutaminase-like putative cysteine protease